jgi:acetyltransferase-like isoleucine patch superfamily enzyme
MGIRDVVKRAVYGYKATSETYVAHLRAIGVEVGEGCEIFCPHETSIDTLNPHLLTKGDHVAITGPATILTHDYSVGVTKNWSHGEVLGAQKPVEIGDNVFLGWGCTVLPGTTIGDDVIIGAGAVATGKIVGEGVYGGNPARLICTLEDYYERRRRSQLPEAVEVYRRYAVRFGREPGPEVFHEYFYLFTPSAEGLDPVFRRKLDDQGNPEECLAYLREGRNDAPFASFDEFTEYARRQ